MNEKQKVSYLLCEPRGNQSVLVDCKYSFRCALDMSNDVEMMIYIGKVAEHNPS